jgi:hypothetical protein
LAILSILLVVCSHPRVSISSSSCSWHYHEVAWLRHRHAIQIGIKWLACNAALASNHGSACVIWSCSFGELVNWPVFQYAATRSLTGEYDPSAAQIERSRILPRGFVKIRLGLTAGHQHTSRRSKHVPAYCHAGNGSP